MSVGLVIVSHSAQLAAGVVELAAQMAPDVKLIAAGGLDDGGIGTSLQKVMSGIEQAESGDGVVVLTDLGSAVMTAEAALEFLGDPGSVRLAAAPVVEGAVAAAVAAQGGADLDAVLRGAQTAWVPENAAAEDTPATETAAAAPATAEASAEAPVTAVLTLINPLGLHARSAAKLAGGLGSLEVDIEINGVDGQSVMMLMTLGAGQGVELHVSATGPDAQRAVDLVRREVEEGFGEI